MADWVPRIAVTPGEPAGIGPELVARLCREPMAAERIIIADPDLMQARGGDPAIPFDHFDPDIPPTAGAVRILPVALHGPSRPGVLDPANARYVLDTLDEAARGCDTALFDALVTGPVHKGIINAAGIPFTGHTEYLATGRAYPVMMLVADTLRVALVTTHLPLADVPAMITQERVERVGRILHDALTRHFGLTSPRICVLGLNPHAGEDGHLGCEEHDAITPAIQALRAAGIDATGPLPADTAFTPTNLQRADAVLAMYHDQGLPVLKHVGFGHAVNVTLGLPFIRTSVDHGTALDLAGSDQADPGSLRAAFTMALTMARQYDQPPVA